MPVPGDSTPSVHFLTLGCPKNDADTRALMRRLDEAGVQLVDDPTAASHIVVNTCGFIQDAKEESIEALLGVCGQYPEKQVIAVGCLVERYRDELAREIPEVSAWFGVVGGEVLRRLPGAIGGPGRDSAVRKVSEREDVSAYAYLKISDGCDESCTFCAIPGIKGPYASVPLGGILREADACLSEGARELVLVGQDTTRWESEGADLPRLIEMLASDTRVCRIRVMYLQPARLGDAFLEFMAGQDKLCRYLDVPFQHSHSDILRRMGRRGDGDSYAGLLGRARMMMPDVTLRSTFIVGFPGETEQHFEHLLSFVRGARFDYGGAFVYSPEEGTAAARLRPLVGRRSAQRRLSVLNEALLDTGERERERLVGSEVDVLIDAVGGEDVIDGVDAVGRTEGQAPDVDGVTYLTASRDGVLRSGDLVRVRVTGVLGCDLMGEVCGP